VVWLRRHFPLADAITLEAAAIDLLGGVAPRKQDHAFTRISSPDERGHMHWLGEWPLGGGLPRVMAGGRRTTVVQFLWERQENRHLSEGFDLVRTCHDPKCISPLHYAQRIPQPHVLDPVAKHELVVEFDRTHPRFNPRPKRWIRFDTHDECPMGHVLAIYNADKRQTYCATCSALERARVRERNELLVRIAHGAGIPAYAHMRPEPEPWDGVDLAVRASEMSRGS